MIVKICGITNPEDAERAVDLGADAIGFIFVPSSPRYIAPSDAAAIITKLPSGILKIGVVVNALRDDIQSIVERTGITRLQMHGDESPEEAEHYTVPVWKAFRVAQDFKPHILNTYAVEACLLDAFSVDLFGGTGKTFDWNIAVEAKRYHRVILSGGLNPENILQAVEKVAPFGVDINSGVESAPGKKDKAKLTRLFSRLNDLKRNR